MKLRIQDFSDNSNKKILDKVLGVPLEWDKRIIKYNQKFDVDKTDYYGWFTAGYLRKEGVIPGNYQTRLLNQRSLSKILERKTISNDFNEEVTIYRLKQDIETYNFLRKVYSAEPWVLILSNYNKKIKSLHTEFIHSIVLTPLAVAAGLKAGAEAKTTNVKKIHKKVMKKLEPVVETSTVVPPSYIDSYFDNPEEFNKRFDELTANKNDWVKVLELMLSYWKIDFTKAPNTKADKKMGIINPYDFCKKQIKTIEEAITMFSDEKNIMLFNTCMGFAQIPELQKLI